MWFVGCRRVLFPGGVGGWLLSRGNVFDDVFGISADAGKKSGRHCIKEGQPDEVESRLIGDDPAVVDWLLRLFVLAAEDRKISRISEWFRINRARLWTFQRFRAAIDLGWP